MYNTYVEIKGGEQILGVYKFNCFPKTSQSKRNGEKQIMKITDVRVRKVNSAGKMRAVVSVTFDDSFVVHDIKVIEGKERMFIAMPSRKTAEGEFKDVAHPINTALRDELQTVILEKYEEVLAEEPEETVEE